MQYWLLVLVELFCSASLCFFQIQLVTSMQLLYQARLLWLMKYNPFSLGLGFACFNSARVNIPQSGEDSLKLTELMELYTKLQEMVLDLETKKHTQAMEIKSLKRRVKKLERRKRSRTHGLKRLYKVRLSAIVESSKDEGLGEEDASKQGRI
nr:hypothetical protein [Tanacetum cinerariifolium]